MLFLVNHLVGNTRAIMVGLKTNILDITMELVVPQYKCNEYLIQIPHHYNIENLPNVLIRNLFSMNIRRYFH